MLNGLDLFSGTGGLSLALRDYVRPIAYCEIDPYCQGVLLSRMESGQLPLGRIWDCIKSFPTRGFKNSSIDIIYGGFPCQDISIAGHGKGLEGEHSGLFFQIVRLAKEIKPQFLFLENVPAVTSRGGLRVVREIAEMGYDCRWCVISAASIGASHLRERWFLLANSHGTRSAGLFCGEKKRQSELRMCFESKEWDSWPENESPLLGMDDVIPFRMDRVRALGNSVHTKQARKAFKELMGLK